MANRCLARTVLAVAMFSLVVTGCAVGLATVPAAHWDTVPTDQRQAMDRQAAADLAAVHAEEVAATEALRVAREAAAVTVAPVHAAASVADGLEPGWAAELQAKEQQKAEARTRIDAARAAGRAAIVVWRERQLTAATAHVAVVVAQRELDRAFLIDRRMNQDESYDVGRFRGQLARAQVRWFDAEAQASEARGEVVRTSGEIATAKEAFAKLVRTREPALYAVAKAPLQLSGWTDAAAIRRRGLTIIDASMQACRQSTCFRRPASETSYLLSPAIRTTR